MLTKFPFFQQGLEDREEGGTPPIIESIRASLAMRIKEDIGAGYITSREEQVWPMAQFFIY